MNLHEPCFKSETHTVYQLIQQFIFFIKDNLLLDVKKIASWHMIKVEKRNNQIYFTKKCMKYMDIVMPLLKR